MFQYFEWNCPADGSLWRQLAERAQEIKNLGTTAVWMPPAYKSMDGDHDTGYAPYDLYDLGEFDQKGSVRTKYGTKDEFITAVKAVKDAGMVAYADIVLNHRMGGDELEDVVVEEVACHDRNQTVGGTRTIRTWSKFTFPGRGDTYSPFKWDRQHFTAFGANADEPHESGKIYRVTGKNFSGEVCFENGNFDYLMGSDVDCYHPDVKAELDRWAAWLVETTGVDGFRLDAVKHIPAPFFKEWLSNVRAHFSGREFFAVGEYWTGSLTEVEGYLAAVDGAMRLFDVPLHYKFHEASQAGASFDISKIFDGTLVQANPLMAVTFVDNHDSQPGQALESWIDDWFKPIAYALILLRKDGYPCVFYGDYFGSSGDPNGNHPLTSHRKLIDDMLQARAKQAYGEQHDYFDHPTCIAWAWTGDADHPGGLVVVLSVGDAGSKHITTPYPKTTYRDLTGRDHEPVTTDENGAADFRSPPGGVSIWCAC
jgi:alpha-amylase